MSGALPVRAGGGGSARRFAAGFTLVEMLVVVGIIMVVAGTLGLVLRAPGEGVALQAGQATLAALCTAARGRAAVTGAEARLVVSADPADAAGRLRYLQVVHADPAGSGHWLAEGGGWVLPAGIYVVPPTAAAVPGEPGWPEARCSTALAPAAETMTINGVAAGSFFSVAFTPRGTTRGGSVVLACGGVSEGAGGPRLAFGHPDRVRGVRLRVSGALTLIDEAAALDP